MNSDNVYELIRAFLAIWPNAEYGPAHIALSDQNLSDDNIRFCHKAIHRCQESGVGDAQELHATDLFLRVLLCVPEDVREVPEDDEGE